MASLPLINYTNVTKLIEMTSNSKHGTNRKHRKKKSSFPKGRKCRLISTRIEAINGHMRIIPGIQFRSSFNEQTSNWENIHVVVPKVLSRDHVVFNLCQ